MHPQPEAGSGLLAEGLAHLVCDACHLLIAHRPGLDPEPARERRAQVELEDDRMHAGAHRGGSRQDPKMHVPDSIPKGAYVDLGGLQHLRQGGTGGLDDRTKRGGFVWGELRQMFTVPLELDDQKPAPDSRLPQGSANMPVFILEDDTARFDQFLCNNLTGYTSRN